MTSRRISFSERQGLVPPPPIQLYGMSERLRNGLWNAMAPVWNDDEVYDFLAESLADEHFRWLRGPQAISHVDLQTAYLQAKWYEAYDFLEFVLSKVGSWNDGYIWKKANEVLEAENSAYRIMNSVLVPITNEHELSSLTTAFENLHPFPNAHEHLTKAAQLLGDRLNPDYANSIKESISAIESLCQTLTNNPKATLGDALKNLENQGIVHQALKATFSALYGYTSDAAGIRHGKGFGADRPDQADARFILITCSAFINYVIAKQAK